MSLFYRFRFVVCLGIGASLLPVVASAQQLDDFANVKILKARSRILHENKRALQEKTGDQSGLGSDLVGSVDCGSIAIGNQAAPTGISQEISIIITGDIINTDNRCVNTNNSSNSNIRR